MSCDRRCFDVKNEKWYKHVDCDTCPGRDGGIKHCVWTENNGHWDSGCGREWSLLQDTPKENGMNYCPICGRLIS